MDAQWIIGHEYGGSKNFMTPVVIETESITNCIAYELACGDSLDRTHKIYGVSVVSYNSKDYTTKRLHNYSKCFQTREEARKHIAKMKEMGYLLLASTPQQTKEFYYKDA